MPLLASMRMLGSKVSPYACTNAFNHWAIFTTPNCVVLSDELLPYVFYLGHQRCEEVKKTQVDRAVTEGMGTLHKLNSGCFPLWYNWILFANVLSIRCFYFDTRYIWGLYWESIRAVWILSVMAGISYYLGQRLMPFNSKVDFSSYLILVLSITSKKFPFKLLGDGGTCL